MKNLRSFINLKNEDKKPVLYVLLLSVFIFFPVNTMWFIERPVWFPYKCFLNGLLITILFLVPSLLWHKITKFYVILVGFFLTICSIIQGCYIYIYNTNISQQSIFAILETNLNESFEFVQSQISFGLLFYIFILLIVPFFFMYKILKLEIKKSKFSLLIAIFFISLGIVLSFSKTMTRLSLDNPVCQIYNSIKIYNQSCKEIKLYQNKMKDKKIENIYYNKNNKANLVVLIGESSSRHHWGLYGYYRNTTPNLNLIKDEIFVYNDAISPFGRTTLCVSAALKCTNLEKIGEIPLTNIFKQAGFKTIWISNQSTIDDTNLIAQLVSNCDESYYVNKGGNQGYSTAYDENIIPVLDKVLSKDKDYNKVIFVHTMGSHVNYASRYPNKFNFFTKTDDITEKKWFKNNSKKYINDYDNSILYTDNVIFNTINLLKNYKNTALIYFSDHGEEVFDTKGHHGHHDAIDSRYYVDIPFIIWLSDSYKKMIPSNFLQCITDSTNKPFKNDAAPYFSLLLSQIKFESEEFSNCPISETYFRKDRIIHNVNYDKTFSGNKGINEPVTDLIK